MTSKSFGINSLMMHRMRHFGSCRKVRLSSTKALPSSFVPCLALEPSELLVPGSVRTLQVLGHQDSLMKEVMTREDKLFALAILSSSACTLCTCLSRREFMGNGLVQVRGEARIGVSEVMEDKEKDFSQARIYNMPDASVSNRDMDEIRMELEKLERTMRDVGNLGSKFRSDESASISQSMRWVNAKSIAPGVLRMKLTTGRDPDEDVNPGEDEESDEEMTERAHRLSFAALNPVPLSNKTEREAVMRSRLMAMETYSLLERLKLGNQLMSSQLAQFTARCSLKF